MLPAVQPSRLATWGSRPVPRCSPGSPRLLRVLQGAQDAAGDRLLDGFDRPFHPVRLPSGEHDEPATMVEGAGAPVAVFSTHPRRAGTDPRDGCPPCRVCGEVSLVRWGRW